MDTKRQTNPEYGTFCGATDPFSLTGQLLRRKKGRHIFYFRLK